MVRETIQGSNLGSPRINTEINSGLSKPSGEKYGWMYDPNSKSFFYHSDNQLKSTNTLNNDDLKALGKFINDITGS